MHRQRRLSVRELETPTHAGWGHPASMAIDECAAPPSFGLGWPNVCAAAVHLRHTYPELEARTDWGHVVPLFYTQKSNARTHTDTHMHVESEHGSPKNKRMYRLID
jgi:hypothetical protein